MQLVDFTRALSHASVNDFSVFLADLQTPLGSLSRWSSRTSDRLYDFAWISLWASGKAGRKYSEV